MKKYLVEFIGTFFLVLTIGMVVIASDVGHFAPIAIGATLMVMVYAGGHVSGAHYNPAVTIAVWLRGRCPSADVAGYIGAQILAAVAAAKLTLLFKGFPQVEPVEIDVHHGLFTEFIGAFGLAYVVLNVATAKATAGNSYYGLAIGFTVTGIAFALGGYSIGAFNPAVAIGGAVVGLVSVSKLWMYFAGTFFGGIVAALTFRFINPDDK
jgi:aquaporin Z